MRSWIVFPRRLERLCCTLGRGVLLIDHSACDQLNSFVTELEAAGGTVQRSVDFEPGLAPILAAPFQRANLSRQRHDSGRSCPQPA
ncbi:MAG UNVERIFIED_CONTAM: hypothetical protein LVR18_42245 [Planctomycetaceae bacterium]